MLIKTAPTKHLYYTNPLDSFPENKNQRHSNIRNRLLALQSSHRALEKFLMKNLEFLATLPHNHYSNTLRHLIETDLNTIAENYLSSLESSSLKNLKHTLELAETDIENLRFWFSQANHCRGHSLKLLEELKQDADALLRRMAHFNRG